MLRPLLALTIAYCSWIGMLITHEFGHVLHAWLSGGRVVQVSMPLLGFSQTIVHPNPRELFVVWGGPIWGVAVPLLLCGASWLVRKRVPHLLRFFTGFCLIANGAYIGTGWYTRAGDAADMLRLGTPVWVMISFGIICASLGLAWWHYTANFSLRKQS